MIAEGSIPDTLKAQVKNLQTSLNGVVLETLTNGLNTNTKTDQSTSHAKPAFENAMNALPAGDLKNKITAVHAALTDFDPANPDKRIALQTSLVALIAEGSIPDTLKAQVKNLQTSLNGVVLETLTNGLNTNTEAAKFTSHAKPAFENAMNALPASDLKNKITAVHAALTDFAPANPDKRIALQTSLVALIAEGSIPDALKDQVKNLQTSLNGVVLETLTNGLNTNTEATKFTSHAKPAFENAMNALPAGDLKNKITAVHAALTDFDPANLDKRVALQTNLVALIAEGSIPDALKDQVKNLQTSLNGVVLNALKDDLAGHTAAAEFTSNAKPAFAKAMTALPEGSLKNHISSVHDSLFDIRNPAENIPAKRTTLDGHLSHLNTQLEFEHIAPDLKGG